MKDAFTKYIEVIANENKEAETMAEELLFHPMNLQTWNPVHVPIRSRKTIL
jgi:hypothetical protein